MTVDLVISAYKADLGWLSSLPREPRFSIIIYDKHGGFRRGMPPEWTVYQRLPNVGKIDGTIAHHIVTHYDCLADWTVFSPDNPFDHLAGRPFADMLRPRESVLVPWLCTLRDWGEDGRLEWSKWTNRPDANGTNWADRYASGKITPAILSFTTWAKEIGVDLSQWPGYSAGAIMGVPRAAIIRNPLATYKWIERCLSHSVEPEIGHYMERLWVSLFKS